MKQFNNLAIKLFKKLAKKTILAILAVLALGLPLLYLTLLNSKPAAAWFDEAWLYRVAIPISAHTAAENNVYITATIDTATPIAAGKMQSDCGDLRFTKENGELLPYFINASPGCNNAATTIQVNFDTFPAGAQTIYYYYGNASAPNGFSSAAFSTAATGETIGSLGSETQGPGPVGYWSFDDGQGQTAQDSSGSNSDGTLGATSGSSSDDPTWQAEDLCVSGKCLFFDGGDYVGIGSTAPNVKTASFWVKPKTNGESIIDLDGGTHYISASSGTITATGFSSPTIYVNGVVSSTLTANSWQQVTITTATAFTAAGINIGKVGATFLTGFVDEVKLYGSLKSAAQVKGLYAARGSPKEVSAQIGGADLSYLSNGLVGYWKMDEASGNATDSSGNGVTLTNNGTAAPDPVSLVNTTGYEAGDASEARQTGGTFSIQSTLKRTGGYALRTNPTTTNVGWVAHGRIYSNATTGSSAIINQAGSWSRFYFRYATKPSADDEPIFDSINTSAALKFELRINSSGNLVAYDSALSSLGTGSTVLAADTWYRIEVAVGTGTSASWEVKIDGTSELSGTANLTTVNHEQLSFGKRTDRNGETVDFYYDDTALDDAAYPGAGQVEAMQIDGDGTYTAFTIGAGGGADWTNIEEIPPDSNTTYLVSTLTTTDASTGTLESAASAGVSGTINAVKPYINIARDGAANGTLKIRVRSGTTDSDGWNLTSIVAYSARQNIYTVDPADSAAWTTDDLDALEVGVVEGETTDKSRLTTAIVMVDFVPGAASTAVGKFGNASVYDGSAKYFNTATAISGIKTISFWVNTADTTNYFINLINSSAYITSSSGTISATGFTSPTIYVNGVPNGTVTASAWNLITVTTNTGINANAFAVGLTNDGSNHYLTNNSKIDDVRIYNRVLTLSEVEGLYNFAPGPAGYWKMDERSGTTVSDYSGNGNTSSAFTGNTAWTNGKFGAGLNFDGTDDVVRVVEGTAFDLGATTDSYTVEGWMKTTANYSGNATVVAKDDGSGAYPFELYLNSSEYACFDISDGTNTPSSCGSTALNDGKWHHLSGVRDVANDKTYLYVDGVQITSTTDSTTATAVNADDLSVGNGGTGTYANNDFNGSIDEVKIYNYARTAKQVVSDMHRDAPTGASNAVGYWEFDEGYGTNANDSTLNDNDLTLSAASWTNSGKFGKAWNGTGALWASRADDSDFDFTATDDLAVSLWFKSDSANNPGAIEYLFNKASATIAGYAVYANTDGTVCFGIDDDTTWNPDVSSCTSTDVYDNSWHHLTGIRDTAADKTLIYIDGVLKDSDTDSTTATLANSLLLYAGDRDGTDNGDEFNGDLDEIKVYRYALTANEVKTEYNQGSSLVLGALGTSTSAGSVLAAGQEYCVPGDTTSCAAPVGRWNFEEKQGTSAYDTSGNGNTGTLGEDGSGTDIPAWKPGKIGGALLFDGAAGLEQDDVVSVAANATINDVFDGGGTISYWIYAKSVGENNTAGGRILEKSGTNTGWGNMLQTCDANRVDLNFFADNAGTDGQWRVDCGINRNQWVHAAITYNDDATTNDPVIYINGVQKTLDLDTNPSLAYVSDASDILYIGNLASAATFDGLIDDIRMYNYARTAAQVAWDYNRGKPVGHWKFDECQGATVYDSSGNKNNGTITIGASGEDTIGTCSTSSTAWGSGATGKRNYSLSLDGSDDLVTITDTANLRFDANTEDFSLFAWVKRTTTGTEYIISKEDADNDGWRMLFTSSNTVQCSEDATDVTSASTVTDTNWHLVGCAIDRDGNGQVYIDGKADGSAVSMGTDAMATTSNITIGTRSYTSTSYLNGQIDDVQIFNYALTATQVKDIYNGGAVNFTPSTGAP